MSAMASLQNAIDCLTNENRLAKMELNDLRQDSKMLRQKLTRKQIQSNEQQNTKPPTSRHTSTDCSNPTTPSTIDNKRCQFSFLNASLEDFEKLREQVKNTHDDVYAFCLFSMIIWSETYDRCYAKKKNSYANANHIRQKSID